jgi:1-acyl-sn-glycerol-3-phosphate acyltransferase
MAEGAVPRGYRWVLGFLRLLVKTFFRRVEVVGLDNVPSEGGGIVVSWHPNGLVDPGLILTQFPRRVVFGARHGIFRFPVLGTLMRQIGTVPIYRAADLPGMDAAARAEANNKSLDALAKAIADGSFSALFPEGVSHDAPHLMELKTGAARLFYRASELAEPGAPPPVVLPVGLHYDDKELFRSNAMVEFHPALKLEGKLAPGPLEPEAARERARALTDAIEKELHDVVLATESWPLHRLMHRARKLIRAERAHRAGANPGRSDIGERVLGFARVREGYYRRMKTHADEVQALVQRVDDYDGDLRTLRLEDHELDRSPRLLSPWLGALLGLQFLAVFFVLPPLLVVGYLVNTPAAALLWLLARIAGKHRKDEATIKVVVGALLFPLSWAAAAVLAAWSHGALHAIDPSIPNTPLLAAFTVALLAAVGGAAALRYLRVARETARAVRVRLTRQLQQKAIARLRQERADLHDAILAFAEGLELPGDVAPDGRIVDGD